MSLTGKDASLLALLAQAPGMPSEERRRVVGELSEEAQKVARALAGTDAGGDAGATADAIRNWASRLSSYDQRRTR